MSSSDQEKKAAIVQLLKDASPKSVPPSSGASKLPLKITFSVFLLSIFCSTIPHEDLNTFFSAITVISGLVLFHLWIKSGRHVRLKNWRLGLTAAILSLQLAGCSGMLMANERIDPLVLYSDVKDLKVGVAYSVSVFGFDPTPATVEAAMQNGGITKLHGHERDRAFGPIRITRVKVYGT